MSESHRARRSRNTSRESGTSFHFYDRVTFRGFIVRGVALGDLVGYSAGLGSASSSATGERVGGRGRRRNTGRRTPQATPSRARGPRASFNNSEISISQLSIVDPSSFRDAEVGERSDHGTQCSIRSNTSSESLSPPDVSDMENSITASASFVEGSATLVNGGTPTEDPIAIGEPVPPILQKLDRDSMDRAMDMPNPDQDAQSSNNSSGDLSADYDESQECGECDDCRISAVKATLIRDVDPTVGAIPHDGKETPKGLINKVERYFRSLPNKIKGSSVGRFLKLGRQSGPIQKLN